MQNPFSWGYLTAPVNETPTWGPFSIAFVSIFGAGLLASLVSYNDLFRQFRKKRLLYNLVRRGAGILMLIFAFGLVFFVFRFLRVSAFYLSFRLWLYLCFLAFIAYGTYLAYQLFAVYPAQVKAEEALRLKKQYLAPSASASSISRSKRHKRRHKHAKPGYKSAQR
ncbi:MAG: hypothetical protein WBW04_17880 [Nitrolancea sp.]